MRYPIDDTLSSLSVFENSTPKSVCPINSDTLEIDPNFPMKFNQFFIIIFVISIEFPAF